MAPIYDTDIAEERWSRSEWNQYELWEKVEVRLRRRKRLWIAATAVAVFGLFSIPIVNDQRAKWESLETARILASDVTWMKKEAGIQRQAFRLTFSSYAGSGRPAYRIEKLASCAGTPELIPPTGTLVREVPLDISGKTRLSVLDAEASARLGIQGLVSEICYDPLLGSITTTQTTAGIGIIPSDDIETGRTDRLSVLLINGASADISFD